MKANYPEDKFLLGCVAHSRANLSMAIILNRLESNRPEILPRLRILGVGCPKSYGVDIPVNLRLINSNGDGVAALDFIGMLFRHPHITRVPSEGAIFPFDHSIQSPTYSKQIDVYFERIIGELSGFD